MGRQRLISFDSERSGKAAARSRVASYAASIGAEERKGRR